MKLFNESNPRLVKVGKNSLNNFKQELIKILSKYHECFASIEGHMLGIYPEITYYRLAIDPNVKPI